jgi:KDO2-lipid IV(A) lauroyltransferase
MNLPVPFAGVYMPHFINLLDKIFYNIRKRYGTILISARNFKNLCIMFFKTIACVGADQNPGDPGNAYWMNFMGRLAPFVTGPSKGAIYNTAVLLVGFKKIKRGQYHFSTQLLTEDGSKFTPPQLTLLYKNELEKIIRADLLTICGATQMEV